MNNAVIAFEKNIFHSPFNTGHFVIDENPEDRVSSDDKMTNILWKMENLFLKAIRRGELCKAKCPRSNQ